MIIHSYFNITMAKLIVNSYEEFASHLGEELGCSEWLQITQDRINGFADATSDHFGNAADASENSFIAHFATSSRGVFDTELAPSLVIVCSTKGTS